MYQLWVHPDFRRNGLATSLKARLETEGQSRELGLIYTITQSRNSHVLNLNLKSGYTRLSENLVWHRMRVSLIKRVG